MKKLMAFVLAGVAALALQSASAAVTILNDTGHTFFVHPVHGPLVKLYPGQSANFCYSNVKWFNVLLKHNGHRTTVCTVMPAVDGGRVRVAKIISPTASGGCHSYYQYLK